MAKLSRTEIVHLARQFEREQLKGYKIVDIDSSYMECYNITIIKLYLVSRNHRIYKVHFDVDNDTLEIRFEGQIKFVD